MMDPAGDALLKSRSGDAEKEEEEVEYKMRFDPKIEFSLLALRDHAEAAERVIREGERHYFANYPLVGTGPVSYEKFLGAVAGQLGKKLRIERLPFEEAVDATCESSFGTKTPEQASRDGPERLVLFYNRRGLIGNSNVLSWLLGRTPTGIAGLVQLKLQEESKEG